MKTLSREGIQRMVDGAGGGSVSGGGISSGDLAGLATQVWVNQNYLSIDFFSSLFKAYGPAETQGDPDVEIVPNDTESTISNIKAMFGFWTEQYISALGQGSGGGGGGATTLSDLLDVEFSGTPSDGQVLKYNGTTHKWYNGTDEGLTSLPWSSITGKPTTLSGYGITDAKIENGTITLGGNSITPLTSSSLNGYATQSWVQQQGYLTSSAISDMATKTWVGNQGYLTSSSSLNATNLTGTIAFARLPTLYWADVAVSSSSNNNASPQFGNLRLRPGSGNYGSYLRFGDGDYAYLAELSDDHLTYRAGSHTFNVSSSEAVQINSSGLRIGGSSGVVLSWDSTNNALKVQKADGTAANLYATGGVSALGMSAGTSSVSSMTFNYLKVDNELTLPADIIAGTAVFIVKNRNDVSGLLLFNSYENSKITSHTYDYNQYDNVGLHGTDYNYNKEWWIDPDGCAKFNRLYLDGSRYLYVSNGTLYYFNGSSSRAL